MNRLKQTIIRIWRDPVWSKIIALGIGGLLTLVYNLIDSHFKATDFKTEFLKFWTLKFELWQFVIVFVSVLFLILIVPAFRKGKVFKYDDETLTLDRNLFKRIRTEVLPQGVILQIKESGFADNDFSMDLLFKVFEILTEEKKSDFFFFNPELNTVKSDLVNAIDSFKDTTRHYFFGTKQRNMLGIPREWVHEQPDRFREAVDNIAASEELFLSAYQNFIRQGIQTLRV